MGASDDLNLYLYTGNDPINFADPLGNGKIRIFRLILDAVTGASRRGRELSRRGAVRERSNQGNILVEGPRSSRAARSIEDEAADGGDVVRHDPHEEGYRPHYQTRGRRGHSFYGSAAGFLTPFTATAHLGEESLVGNVIDFFNPLSDAAELFGVAEDIQCGNNGILCDPDLGESAFQNWPGQEQNVEPADAQGDSWSIVDGIVSGTRCTGRLNCNSE